MEIIKLILGIVVLMVCAVIGHNIRNSWIGDCEDCDNDYIQSLRDSRW